MKTTIYRLITLVVLGFLMHSNNVFAQTTNQPTMKSYVAIFEIPATDMERAVSFYQEILGITIERMEFPGMEMGLLPYEDQMVTGVIMKGEGYEPSASGVTIYMNNHVHAALSV